MHVLVAVLPVVLAAAGPRPAVAPVSVSVPVPTGARAGALGDAGATAWRSARGTLRSARGHLGVVGADAAAFATEHAAELGLLPGEVLRVDADETDELGHRHVRLERVVGSLPVRFDMVRLHAGAAGVVHGVEAETSDLSGLRVQAPRVAPWQAVDVARGGHVGTLLDEPTTRLVVLGNHAPRGVARMAWEVRIAFTRGRDRVPFVADVYVDALTRDVLLSLPRVYTGTPTTMQSNGLLGSVTLDVTQYSDGVLMENTASISGGQIITLNGAAENAAYLTASTSQPFTDATAVTIHDAIRRVYDHFDSAYGWKNWDLGVQPAGPGGNLIGIAHQGNQLNNAYFTTGTSNGRVFGIMAFGDGDGQRFRPLARCFDVTGHELGHGVVEGTARLVYQFQSGALNEHFADVFGWLMDPGDDLIGEDCVGPDLQPALRDMCNPGNVPQPQPAHMNQYQDLPNTEDGDYGGVHVNSGIPNKAACNARAAVGADLVGRTWFQALRHHLGAQATFADMVAATGSSCTEVGGTAEQCASIASAWVSVGLGSAASGGSCPANATLQDGACFCNVGFRPDSSGAACEPVANVNCPPNSTEQGGACYCNEGYVPDSAGSSCVLERDQCPSNSHREGGSCVCDACYQGNPNGNGEGCTPTPSCATCAHPLETGASGTCECIPGISKVCGPTSMNYTVTVMGQEVRGEQCCRPDDPCGWGGDGFCDCNGECSFDNADCAAPATATPVCAARNPGNCGNEVWAGRCVDNLLIWCDDRTVPGSPYVSYYNCPDYMAGYVCGADTVNGGFNCVERRSNCGDVPSSGRCNGTTAQYCDDGVLQTVDCEGRGCGPYTYMGGMVEFCLPCPPNATYNEADNTCSCNSGYVPDEAGSACVSSGGGGGGDTACDGGACPEDAEEECACARVEDRAVPGVLGLFLLALVRGRRRA